LIQENRKPILEDSDILWPGTRVEIESASENGVVLHSNGYGKTYTVKTVSGIVITLHKSEVKEIK